MTRSPSSGKAKIKATWTPAIHEIFVDSCLEQISKGNRPGTHFTKEGWKNIGESLYKKAGFRYDKKQLKNHWDSTKEQWKIWCKLISTSSMKWNSETSTFEASDENWAEYIHAHPEAAQYRFKELQHPDKLVIIYDFAINSGDTETPSQHKRQNDSSTSSTLHTKDQDSTILHDKKKRLENSSTNQPNYGRKIASETSICSSSLKRPKAFWTPNLHKVFVDLCVDEVLKGNRPGTHFTKEGWSNIVLSFHKKTGVRFDRMQLKNHWDITKEQWKIWCKLVGTRSMKWDPNGNEFGASEEDWVNYVEANPEAAQFRFKELQLADKLEIIFDGIINNGETEPPNQNRRLYDGSTASLLHMEEPIMAKPERMIKPFSEAVESRSALTVLSTQEKLTYSIGECIKCLDGMEEIEQGSELYLFALDIFLKKEYREIFLQLKMPSVRIAWLERLKSTVPPFQVV